LALLSRLPFVVRVLLAFGLGAAGAWAMPPDPQPLALILHHAGVLALLMTVSRKRAGFAIGWAAGFGFHLAGLSWIGEAFLVDANQFGWMRPFAIAGLPAALAVFSGLAATLCVWRARQHVLGNVLLYAATFGAAEWLRSHILTGFPWNLPVQAWDATPGVLQAVAWVGPYGVSLATVIAAAAVAALILGPLRRAAWVMPAACLPLIVLAVFGNRHYLQAPAVMPAVAGVKLRIVQPNIPQKEKWRQDLRNAHFAQHMALSADAAASGVTHIIWPEAATPFLLVESPTALAAIQQIVPKGGALLTGTPRRATAEAGATPASGGDQFSNALVVIDDSGAVTDTYDKHHLVPFGEYVPLRDWLPVDRLAPGRGDFVAGSGRRAIMIPGAPAAGVLICYEAIFSDEAAGYDISHEWLLNVTNDAWFGSSSGPHQHLSIARLRAIEQGVPLIRVANTGISAVIDPYGRIVQSLPIGTAGTIDTDLPQALPQKPLYIRFRYSISLSLITLVLAASQIFGSKPIRTDVA
jgi:apolipoprotein N-acyltransferase